MSRARYVKPTSKAMSNKKRPAAEAEPSNRVSTKRFKTAAVGDEETHKDDKIPPTLLTDKATNQWETVREAWQKSNADSCVETWASVMPWKTKKDGPGKTLLPPRVEKPEEMIKRIPELFWEARRLCAAMAE